LDWERCTGSLSSQGLKPQGLKQQGLRLRNWRPGDQYQPQGRIAAEKIKTLFQECRVPLWERRTWPVISTSSTNEGQSESIVWSRRFGVASQFAAGPESRKVLKIREVMESKPQPEASMFSEGAL
jgi:tRNA(Ile)-lysidine synthase